MQKIYLLVSNTGDLLIGINMSKKNIEKIMYTKICPVCGKEFITLNNRKKYCCTNCNAAAYRDRNRVKHPKVCPICGKEFSARRSIDVYCSKECYEESKVIYRREHRVVKEAFKKTCPVCGKEFMTKLDRKIYCSDKCQWQAYRKEHLEEMRQKSRAHYHNNKEWYKKWEEANKEKRLRQKHEYYLNHKEEKKEYAELNKERIRVNKRNLHHKNKKDPSYRLLRKCRDFVHRCLKSTKLHRTHTILGYTPEELKKYLEANFYRSMNWEVQNWEIHHIRPLDTFNFLNEDGTDNYDVIREANSLDNLIPLLREDHKKVTAMYNSKGEWLSKEEIQQMFMGDK